MCGAEQLSSVGKTGSTLNDRSKGQTEYETAGLSRNMGRERKSKGQWKQRVSEVNESEGLAMEIWPVRRNTSGQARDKGQEGAA